MPTGPLTVSLRQLPNTILSPEDLFGQTFWAFNERLVEEPDGARVVFSTQTPFLRNKAMFFQDRLLLYPGVHYNELGEGSIEFITPQPPAAQAILTATYLKLNAMEGLGWIFNEAPALDQQPDGNRQDFNTAHPISEDLIQIGADGLILVPEEDFTLTDDTTIHFVVPPPMSTQNDPHFLRWTYISVP